MPAVDTVLLPLCVGLTLLGIIATGVAWRRGNKGRVIQGVALALAPIALYFSGLLRLLWNGVVAVGTWASNVIFSPAIWFGLSLLGLCLVLWVVGSIVARRFPSKAKSKGSAPAAGGRASSPAVGGSASRGTVAQNAATKGNGAAKGSARKGAPASQAPVDDEMAEIEALLKSRGIE
jgi:hypothetical protein